MQWQGQEPPLEMSSTDKTGHWDYLNQNLNPIPITDVTNVNVRNKLLVLYKKKFVHIYGICTAQQT